MKWIVKRFNSRIGTAPRSIRPGYNGLHLYTSLMKEENILTISSRSTTLRRFLQTLSRSVIFTETRQTKVPLKAPKLSLPGELWLLVCDT
jgi:hypothetical protein